MLLLSRNSIQEIKYYINLCVNHCLSKRQLRDRIKSTKCKLRENSGDIVYEFYDFIKHPVVIKNKYKAEEITEKYLKQLILEDMGEFLKQLGEGFSYIDNEYKIKIGDRYNYIDLLLYNINFNCYVVVELKVTEIKAEHIGQIKKYMNYIDKNLKNINQDRTIGIVICKKDNEFLIQYCSDERIYRTTFEISEDALEYIAI